MSVAVTLTTGTAVGEYQLLEKLGEGGMGVVYKARRHGRAPAVAVKVMAPDKAANPVRLRRFEQEFRAASRLDHPNIVKMLDFGIAGSLHFLVMELVEGESLGSRIQRLGRLPAAEAVDIIAQTAQGLHHAHRSGLVHRDVKPDNILLTPDGVAKLTDLGLVKILDEDTNLTRVNSGLGTPNFMAPEQFNDAKHADARCDVYSLGATLYMCLTGKLPFHGPSPLVVLKKKSQCELIPVNMLVPGLDERVERAIARALSLDPGKRQTDCLEFIAELTGRPIGQSVEVRLQAAAAERRRQTRHPSRRQGGCMPLSSHRDDVWTARVNDISATGVALLVNRRFEVGSVLVVNLPGQGDEPSRSFVVRVVRHQAQARRRHLLGCAFASALTEEEVSALL